jgi:hypothetical protein
MTGRRFGGALAAVALSVLATACGDDGAAVDESQRAVCDELQVMVDDLVAGDGDAALAALDGLALAVMDAEEGPVQASGDDFLRAIGDTVPDPGSLTVAESKAIGDRVLAAGEAGLVGMINGCQEAGRPIENLPS